jgi:predicted TIM-barrel fold metal-dependent hydrolase
MPIRSRRFILAVLPWSLVFAQGRPAVDHHQHLFSPAAAALSASARTVTADQLVKALDSAGVRRAVVLSVAYQFGNPNRPPVDDEYAKVKAENDWTAEQVARFPNRLLALCALNPLKDYALDEIDRCAKDPRLRAGIKLHFGNSDVQLDKPDHVARVRAVFRRANEHRMAIIVHMHSSFNQHRPYGATQARTFLTELLPTAPDVPVQIAHLTGAGGYDDPATDEALGVFADAIGKHDPLMARVYFDISGVAGVGGWKARAPRIAERVRQLGVDRILFGTDAVAGGPMSPLQAWTAFRQLPLTEAEFRAIEANVAPYW